MQQQYGQRRSEAAEPTAAEWAVFASELGWMAAAWRGGRLVALTFGHTTAAQAAESLHCRTPGGLAAEPMDGYGDLVSRMQAYSRGEEVDLSEVEIDIDDLSDFQRQVVAQCQRIPVGQTISYGQLAARAGSPRAARAVGNVMAGNRIPLVVPCHRVVGGKGALGGFSAPDGLRMKKRLLRLERTATATSEAPGDSR